MVKLSDIKTKKVLTVDFNFVYFQQLTQTNPKEDHMRKVIGSIELRWPDDELHEYLVKKMTEHYSDIVVSQDRGVITIRSDSEVVIEYSWFDEAVNSSGLTRGMTYHEESAQRGMWWRGLMLNRQGFIEGFSKERIVLSTQTPIKPFSFLVRFPNEETKRFAEEWAETLEYGTMTDYIIAAMDDFNQRWLAEHSRTQQREE